MSDYPLILEFKVPTPSVRDFCRTIKNYLIINEGLKFCEFVDKISDITFEEDLVTTSVYADGLDIVHDDRIMHMSFSPLYAEGDFSKIDHKIFRITATFSYISNGDYEVRQCAEDIIVNEKLVPKKNKRTRL